MKMYEKMGIDFNTKEGLTQFTELFCGDIPDGMRKPDECCPLSNCWSCKIERLFADVPTKTVKRWEIYNGDFVRAQTEFNNFCKKEYAKNGCGSCSHNLGENCFANWLMEEIEMEVY